MLRARHRRPTEPIGSQVRRRLRLRVTPTWGEAPTARLRAVDPRRRRGLPVLSAGKTGRASPMVRRSQSVSAVGAAAPR